MVARCFTFSGPDLPLDAHFAFGNFLNDALNSESIKINGMDQQYDHIWIKLT